MNEAARMAGRKGVASAEDIDSKAIKYGFGIRYAVDLGMPEFIDYWGGGDILCQRERLLVQALGGTGRWGASEIADSQHP